MIETFAHFEKAKNSTPFFWTWIYTAGAEAVQSVKWIWCVWASSHHKVSLHFFGLYKHKASFQDSKAAQKWTSGEVWKLLQVSSDRAWRSLKCVFLTCNTFPSHSYPDLSFPFLLFQMPTMKLNELLEDFYITMKKTDGSDFLARFDNAWTRWSRMWVLFSPSPAAPSALPPESSRRSLKSRARLGWLVSTLAMLTASPFLMKKRCGRQDAWEITAP